MDWHIAFVAILALAALCEWPVDSAYQVNRIGVLTNKIDHPMTRHHLEYMIGDLTMTSLKKQPFSTFPNLHSSFS